MSYILEGSGIEFKMGNELFLYIQINLSGFGDFRQHRGTTNEINNDRDKNNFVLMVRT